MSLLLSAKRSGKHRSNVYVTPTATTSTTTSSTDANTNTTSSSTTTTTNATSSNNNTIITTRNPIIPSQRQSSSITGSMGGKIPISSETLDAIQAEYESSRPTSQYQLANCIKTCPLILNIHAQSIPKQHHSHDNLTKDSVEYTTMVMQELHLKQDTNNNDDNDAQMMIHKQNFIKAMDKLMTMVKSIDRDVHDWNDATLKLSNVLLLPQNHTHHKDDDDDDDDHRFIHDSHCDTEEESHYPPFPSSSSSSPNQKAPSTHSVKSAPFPTFSLWSKDPRYKKTNYYNNHNNHNIIHKVKKHKTSFKYRTSNIKAYLHLLRRNDIKGRWDKVSLFQNDGWDQIKYGSIPERIARRRNVMDDKEEQSSSKKDSSTLTPKDVLPTPTTTTTTTATSHKKEEPLYIRLARLFQKKTEEEEEKVRQKEHEKEIRIDREMEESEERLAKKEQEEKDAATKLLRPLTDDENDIVQEALYGDGVPSEKVATSETDSVQRKSMHTLRPCAWLNDEVIHYFLHVLSMRDEFLSKKISGRKRSHFFKSFFFTKLLDEGATNTYRYSNVKRWSKKVPGKDIFKLDKIFFVCNISGMHWTCVCAFMKDKRIQFYDSMGGSGHDYVEGVFQYFKDEWKSKHDSEMPDAHLWEVNGDTPVGTPKQRNGYDCGVFTCMFCDFLSMDIALTFTQHHIDQCRDRIALSIMKGIAIE